MTAPTTTEATQPNAARPPLYTQAFIGICLVTLFGFAQNFLLQAILPLRVLELGGDTTLVGLVFAIYTIPSVVFRPFIGRVADRWGSERVLLFGSVGIAMAASVYFIASLPVLLVLLCVQGVVWASLSTGSAALLARLAPQGRRVEASGIYDLMPGLAALTVPSAGVLLLASFGTPGPFALGLALGVGAAIVCIAVFPPRRPVADLGTWRGSRRAILEPSALVPMVLMLLFTSANSLFLVYPPLIAQDRGIPLADLAIYYALAGLVLVVTRARAGLLERVPRSTTVAVGAALAVVALVVGALAESIVTLTAAAVLFNFAYGFSTPAALASVMEHAPRDRLGAAMATYTLGFQIGSGFGAALWGALIGPLGFAAVFFLAAGIQVALSVFSIAWRATLDGGPQPRSE